ncbi:hypothetical protein SNEBB_007489 [Seison nebaliae]|nr:hypothetical protein SNEBB_007489 [Seison nebaliae]
MSQRQHSTFTYEDDPSLLSHNDDYKYLDLDMREKKGTWLDIPYYGIRDRRVMGAMIGFTVIFGYNITSKRPRFSNKPLMLLNGLFMGTLGHFIGKFEDNRRLNRDMVIWDYVRKHPENFPELHNKSKLVGELMRDWRPIR